MQNLGSVETHGSFCWALVYVSHVALLLDGVKLH